jgi:HSP20 family molecular chaperone IbpA
MSNTSATQSSLIETRGKQAVEREGTRPGWVFRPDVDIVEYAEGFVVSADLPGVDESGVAVELKDGVLTIDANLSVLPDSGWRPVYSEYRLGGYRRAFDLGDGIDAGSIRAEMRDGVLTLHLPKPEQRKPRLIPVHRG